MPELPRGARQPAAYDLEVEGLRLAFDEVWWERALLVPPRRVLLHGLARLAFETSPGRGRPRDADAERARRLVERALEDVVAEQRDDEARDVDVVGGPDEAFYRSVALRAGVPLRLARLACVVLNRRPLLARRRWLLRSDGGRRTS